MLGPSASISDCGDDCFECNLCYMSNDPDNLYPVCNDFRPMRYSSPCTYKSRWTGDLCNANGPCFKSYPFGDPEKYRAPDAECRTLPNPYLDLSAMKYGTRTCKTKQGFCSECSGEPCNWSYRTDDPDRWKGATAMCRCR